MYCKNCGNKLDSETNYCDKCGKKVEKEEQKVYCTYCGKKINESDVICPFCLKKVKSKSLINFDFQTKILLILSFLVPFMGLIFYVILKDKNNEEAKEIFNYTLYGFIFWLFFKIIF